jgi:tetratricopeptide (TPR) repeat protein
MPSVIFAAWDPLGWLHELGWYRAWMRAEWFQSFRPTWERYQLDWALVGLALLAALLLLWWLVRRLRPRNGWFGGDVLDARKSGRQTAEHLLAQGELVLAAQAFDQAGEPARAIEAFLAAGAHARAAEVAERCGQHAQAAELYHQARDEASSVRMLVLAGQVDQAVEQLVAAGQSPDAAALLLQAGRKVEAARLLDRVGLHTRAAELFREAGEPMAAADALLALVAASHAGFTQEEQDMMLEGAAALQRAGRQRESAELLLGAGQWGEAARRLEKLGEPARAAAAWEKAGDLLHAASLCPDPGRRLELLERAKRQGQSVPEATWTAALTAAGRPDEAAARLLAAGDLDAAVTAHRATGNLSEAAQLLARAGRHLEAGTAFESAADLDAAQEQYLLAGQKEAAARVAERGGRCLEAGRLWLELGQLPRAVAALQRVTPEDPRLREAQLLLAEAFEGLGDARMARHTYERLLSGQSVGRETLEAHYRYACFLSDTGLPADQELARRFFQDLLAIDYGYRDVRSRLDRLERRGVPTT